MDKEIKVGPGMFVTYSYKLYNEKNGNLLFEATSEAPDEMVYGVSHEVVPGLIAAIKDLKAGDKFEVTLPPEAAFGPRYDDNVVKLEREIFMRDGEWAEEVKVGAMLPMMTAEGFRIEGKVKDIDDKHVTMDFNHPFAGKTVRYEGRVESVREATPEELHPVSGCCGGGCGGGDCGSEGNCSSEGSCGSGCCSGCCANE